MSRIPPPLRLDSLVARCSSQQFELNHVQASRRKALYQHMGSLRNDVDTSMTAAQKKEMRAMMIDARKGDMIKEKNSKTERRLEKERFENLLKGWLEVLVHARFMVRVEAKFHVDMAAEIVHRHQNAAASKIQVAFER